MHQNDGAQVDAGSEGKNHLLSSGVLSALDHRLVTNVMRKLV